MLLDGNLSHTKVGTLWGVNEQLFQLRINWMRTPWDKDKDKPMFYVPQINIWPGQSRPYERVPIRNRTIGARIIRFLTSYSLEDTNHPTVLKYNEQEHVFSY